MVSSTLALLIAILVGAAVAINPVIKSKYVAASSINTMNNNTNLVALLALKQAITNDPTNFLALWNTSVSPDYCNWRGVRCMNGTHDVIALLLDSNQLNGTLPPQLNQLSQLAYLNVSNNSFSGLIPTEFRELSSLTHLDLSFNQFIGSIPSSLANCTRLQFLVLRKNALSGKFPSFVTSLTDIVYLDLARNSFLGQQLPSDIGRLSNLQFLQLHFSGLVGSLPPSITNCTSLIWLHLRGNNLTGPLPSDWSKLSHILHFHLQENLLTGSIPATLGNCTTLVELNLNNNFLTGEVPESLGRLALLQYLVLFSNGIGGAIPTSLVNCTGLISLQLGSNNLSGPIPSGIGQLKQVEFMALVANTKLSGRIPDTIGDCTQLKGLSVRLTEVGGPLPASLYNLSKLQTLRLSSCRFSGRLSEDVKNLSALITLALDWNAFVGRLPSGLGELTELQGLELHHNRFEGRIPQLWRGTSMSKIDLSYNLLTGNIPDELSQMQLLNNLYLQNNHLSGDIPDHVFGSLTRLLNLDLSHNKLTGPIPQSLFVSQSLDLSFNNLTGTLGPSMGDMHMVTTIRLAGNHFTGAIPDISGCQGLQELDLSVNNLEGEIPSILGSLVVLQYLDLSHNKLSGALPQSLGDLRNLVSLNVSYNALQGMIPRTGIYKNSSAAAFMGNPDLCGYPLSKSCNSKSRTTLIVSICTTVGLGLLMILVCICLWWRFSLSATNRIPLDDSDQEWIGMQKTELRAWTARELRAATNGFDNASIIGSGGASICFKGVMEIDGSRRLVAIKRFNMRSQNQREARRGFVQELNILSQVRHRNLVKTLGYCMDEGVVALVLELMENGNLEKLLQGSELKSLSWVERLSIAMDVAEGLVYLHHEFIQPIIHCDLKPENILIGSDMVAKISDFGIAKLLDHNQTRDLSTSNFRGTFGYAAPECAAGSLISTKADLYSYGVLLIQLVTGMTPKSPQLHGITLHIWAGELLKSGRITEGLLDTAVQESIEKDTAILQQLEELLDLGVKCTNDIATARPDIKNVREALVKLTSYKAQPCCMSLQPPGQY